MKIDPNATCSGKELGWLLGCTDRAVRMLCDKGVVIRASRGRYRLESVHRAVEHYREVAAGRGGEGAMLDLTTERAKLAAVQREQIELKIAIQRRELLRRDEVMSTWGPIVLGFRGRALGWPSKALFVCPIFDLGRQGGA